MVISSYPAKNIVLAEDNSGDVMLVRLALKNSGLDCELCVLDDGDKVVSFIREFDANPNAAPIDLLLLDMHLPKRDGEEILQFLRSSAHCAQTPVVVLSASDMPQDHGQAQKYAALHYFRKPSDLAGYLQLGIMVRDLLSSGNTPAVSRKERGAEK